MYLELATRNLGRYRTRSILAITGIVIGVMAVASIGIFGNSMKKTVMDRFEDIADTIIIVPKHTQGYNEIDGKDIDIIGKIDGVERVIPVKSKRIMVEYRGSKAFITVYGINEDDLQYLFDVYDGEIRLKSTAVVGYSLGDEFDIRPGKQINVGGLNFRVSGILGEKGLSPGVDPDYAVFLSVDDFEKLSDQGYTMAVVKADTIEHIDWIAESIYDAINTRDEKINIRTLESILENIEENLSTISNFLMAIAAVSLLVAGVSILNIMLMSTVERTKEIGIMRATGAHQGSVLLIFLLEALILGIAGSTAGGILSIAGGYLIVSRMGLSTAYVLDPSSIPYIVEGFAVGIITSVASGLYPAWRASRLEPIEALRYE